MDEEAKTPSDRIEEALDQRAPDEAAALQAGFLVPRETRDGVRYVRSRKKPRHASRIGCYCLGILVVLPAAAVAAIILLTIDAAAIAGWQFALGFLYPLQLALDWAAVARTTWRTVAYWVGDLELELSADRLRVGSRCGPMWLDSQSVLVADIKQLVVGKRPEGEGATIWELIARRHDDSLLLLVSADDPGNVIPIAKDLHARMARRQVRRDRWPALAEEDRPAEALPDRPPPRPLLPGGWAWLGIHVLGSVGLWQVFTQVRLQPPQPPWRFFLVVGMAFLQVLIFLVNIAMLMNTARARSKSS